MFRLIWLLHIIQHVTRGGGGKVGIYGARISNAKNNNYRQLDEVKKNKVDSFKSLIAGVVYTVKMKIKTSKGQIEYLKPDESAANRTNPL